jgi:hypothetical protein
MYKFREEKTLLVKVFSLERKLYVCGLNSTDRSG